ncbi:MAG: hypothetical protein Q8P41_17255 [Pseudomonadota bacterium]|nr:hypothetical protein [Pseudomonadota bacterium]
MALTPRLLLALALLLAMIEVGLNAPAIVPAWASWLAGAVHVVGLAWWVRAPRSVAAGALALLPLLVGGILEGALSPSGVHHGKILPVVALAGWLVAQVRGGPDADRNAVEAACGLTAAAYALAAYAKLAGAGLLWFDPDYLGLLLVERAVGAPAPLAALRLAVAEQPTLCVLLAGGALLTEASGALFVWAPARRPVALALLAMHAGIALLMGYVYVSWALVVVALAGFAGRAR